MNIVFGNGNGTFGLLKTWSIGNESSPQGITAADFNGDNYLDIAVANMYNNNISLFFGNGNGSFSAQTTVSTGRNSNPYSISVSDFNVDGYIDIVVDNDGSRTIGILLGFGNGSFQSYQTYFIGAFYRTFSFAIGDFNSDRRPDVVFTYFANSDGNEGIYANYNVSIFFGYGNGTLSPKVVFPIANLTRYPVVSVGDVNGDGYLDIIATVTNIYYSISIFIGDGKGNFQPQLVSTILDNSEIVVSKVADFNGDGYQDILALEQTSGGVVILLNKGWCYPNTTAKTSTLIY